MNKYWARLVLTDTDVTVEKILEQLNTNFPKANAVINTEIEKEEGVGCINLYARSSYRVNNILKALPSKQVATFTFWS